MLLFWHFGKENGKTREKRKEIFIFLMGNLISDYEGQVFFAPLIFYSLSLSTHSHS
jgi:hypothetical protein